MESWWYGGSLSWKFALRNLPCWTTPAANSLRTPFNPPEADTVCWSTKPPRHCDQFSARAWPNEPYAAAISHAPVAVHAHGKPNARMLYTLHNNDTKWFLTLFSSLAPQEKTLLFELLKVARLVQVWDSPLAMASSSSQTVLRTGGVNCFRDCIVSTYSLSVVRGQMPRTTAGNKFFVARKKSKYSNMSKQRACAFLKQIMSLTVSRFKTKEYRKRQMP